MNAKNNEPSHLGELKNPTQKDGDIIENIRTTTMTIVHSDDNEYVYKDKDVCYENLSMLEMFGNVVGRLAGTIQYGQTKGMKEEYIITITRRIRDN